MLLVIDNYDSFTYNLVQFLGMLGADVNVVRNDKVTPEEISKMKPERIVISPGPGTPDDAGISKAVISNFSGKIPILGVCLGHQCIGDVFGYPVVSAKELVHGKTTAVYHTGEGVFKDIPQGLIAARYHSLVLERDHVSEELKVVAKTRDDTIMAVQHNSHLTFGVQFHPESIATEYGVEILENFLSC